MLIPDLYRNLHGTQHHSYRYLHVSSPARLRKGLTAQRLPCISHTIRRRLRCRRYLPLNTQLYPHWLYVHQSRRDTKLTSSGDPHPSPLLYHFSIPLPSLRPSLSIPLLPTIPTRQSECQSALWRGHFEL